MTNVPGGPAIVIRVKNVSTLIAQQGGDTGSLVYKLAPQTLTNKVYDEMRTKLAEGLVQQGVDADVQVASLPSTIARVPNTDLLTGMAAGALGVGALLLIKRLVTGR